jgi:hypothetical protein
VSVCGWGPKIFLITLSLAAAWEFRALARAASYNYILILPRAAAKKNKRGADFRHQAKIRVGRGGAVPGEAAAGALLFLFLACSLLQISQAQWEICHPRVPYDLVRLAQWRAHMKIASRRAQPNGRGRRFLTGAISDDAVRVHERSYRERVKSVHALLRSISRTRSARNAMRMKQQQKMRFYFGADEFRLCGFCARQMMRFANERAENLNNLYWSPIFLLWIFVDLNSVLAAIDWAVVLNFQFVNRLACFSKFKTNFVTCSIATEILACYKRSIISILQIFVFKYFEGTLIIWFESI